MNTNDQTNRKIEIAKLEARYAKAEAVITHLQLTLWQMRDKQWNRMAELRCQRMLLKINERADL